MNVLVLIFGVLKENGLEKKGKEIKQVQVYTLPLGKAEPGFDNGLASMIQQQLLWYS